MTVNTPSLSSMEEQLIEVFHQETLAFMEVEYHEDIPLLSHTIFKQGRKLFGPDWGGAPKLINGGQSISSYPLVDMFLGKLQKKQLVQWSPRGKVSARSRTYGVWSLTPFGRKLLGLPSVG